jgi:hypothetical protein
MSQVNTYSPDGRSRLCVQADRDGGQVMLGVQHAEVVTEGPSRVGESSRPVDGSPVFKELGGLWANFDRDGVNNLIRALREMRDKAFGRDE